MGKATMILAGDCCRKAAMAALIVRPVALPSSTKIHFRPVTRIGGFLKSFAFEAQICLSLRNKASQIQPSFTATSRSFFALFVPFRGDSGSPKSASPARQRSRNHTGCRSRHEVAIPRTYWARSNASGDGHLSWLKLPLSCSTESYSCFSSHSASSCSTKVR